MKNGNTIFIDKWQQWGTLAPLIRRIYNLFLFWEHEIICSKSTRKAKRNSNTFTPCSQASKCQWYLRNLFKWKWLESGSRDARQGETGYQEASVSTDLFSAFDICWTIFQETLEANCLIYFLPFCYYPEKEKKIFWPFIVAQMQIESSLLTVIKS